MFLLCGHHFPVDRVCLCYFLAVSLVLQEGLVGQLGVKSLYQQVQGYEVTTSLFSVETTQCTNSLPYKLNECVIYFIQYKSVIDYKYQVSQNFKPFFSSMKNCYFLAATLEPLFSHNVGPNRLLNTIRGNCFSKKLPLIKGEEKNKAA